MDINTNTLQQQAAVMTPLKLVNVNPSVDAPVKSVGDAGRKVESADATPVAEATESKNPDGLQQAVGQLNDYVQTMQRDLQFSIDKESGVMVVKVIDTNSEKVIRQIPAEETLRLARSLAEHNVEAAFNIFNSRA